MAPRINPILGNARNNYLYGTDFGDVIDGGLGNDYLRGKGGSDELWGGAGSDRFVFERTKALNGVDIIKDYVYAPTAGGGERDVLDFTLFGFARNALSRNSGIENGIDNVVVIVEEEGVTRVGVSPSGDGQPFQLLAELEGLYAGNLVHFRIGEYTFTRPVQGVVDQGLRDDIGTALRYDIGNGDRYGDGMVDQWDYRDDDALFDDRLIVQDGSGGSIGAEVLIGDRVRGFGGTTAFTPGVTAIDVPQWLWGIGFGDHVYDAAFQVYYGTYDAATDIFTVTSTPGTTADPTSATHTMVLYDNDPAEFAVGALGGMVLQGVYAESQWYIDRVTSKLQYDTDGIFAAQEYDVLSFENVLYGTAGTDAFNGGFGIDILYGGAGNDLLFGGIDGRWREITFDVLPPRANGNDWLYGGAGADLFFAANLVESGVDSIKDFAGTDNPDTSDLIFMARDPLVIESFFDSGPGSDVWPQNLAFYQEDGDGGLFDIGVLTAAPGATLHEAMLQANGTRWGIPENLTGPYNVYRFDYSGKEYLFWDSLGDGYAAPVDGGFDVLPLSGIDDVIVEITGAVGLTAGHIFLMEVMPPA